MPVFTPADVAPVAPVTASPVITSPVAAAQPAAPEAAPAPMVAVAAPVQPYVLPTQALAGVAASQGLEWVQSDAEKIRAAQEAMAREPKPVHVPREPKPVIAIDEGPLVLVETRKDLSQIKLPFEAPASSGQQTHA